MGKIQVTKDPAIRVVLLPRDTNSLGTIFGGIILSYIDQAGAVAVAKATAQRFVTVALKEVVFKQPVRLGEVVSFYAEVIKVGRTSITVEVDVEVNRGDGSVREVTEAQVTFVCINAEGKPIPVELRNKS
jgi:acyl-CoA thioesterase YciA